MVKIYLKLHKSRNKLVVTYTNLCDF